MSDGLEEAIVALVIRGEEQAATAAERIEADLVSVERAGRSAESAARSAEAATRDFEIGVRHAMHKAVAALHLARSIAKAGGAGEDSVLSGTLEVGAGVATGAAHGFRVGSMFGPEGAAIAATIGGIAAGVNSLNEYEKRRDEHASHLAHEITKEMQKQRDLDLGRTLLEQAGLATLGAKLRARD